jgi:hypothetical protein
MRDFEFGVFLCRRGEERNGEAEFIERFGSRAVDEFAPMRELRRGWGPNEKDVEIELRGRLIEDDGDGGGVMLKDVVSKGVDVVGCVERAVELIAGCAKGRQNTDIEYNVTCHASLRK